jgi:hypothetical protein
MIGFTAEVGMTLSVGNERREAPTAEAELPCGAQIATLSRDISL